MRVQHRDSGLDPRASHGPQEHDHLVPDRVQPQHRSCALEGRGVSGGLRLLCLRPGARSDPACHELSPPRNKTGHSSAGCAVLGHDAKNLHGVVPLRPENGKGPEWPENGKGSECVRYSFVQYSKDPCYKRTRGEAEARARGDPEQLRKDAEKAAKKAIALARAERKDKRKRE